MSRFFLEFPTLLSLIPRTWRQFQAHHYNCYHYHQHVPQCRLAKFKKLLFFCFLFVYTLWCSGKLKSTKRKVHFFYLPFCIFFRLGLSYLFLSQTPENLVGLILSGGFCKVHITFGSMVKFQSFAQFPVDHFY